MRIQCSLIVSYCIIFVPAYDNPTGYIAVGSIPKDCWIAEHHIFAEEGKCETIHKVFGCFSEQLMYPISPDCSLNGNGSACRMEVEYVEWI